MDHSSIVLTTGSTAWPLRSYIHVVQHTAHARLFAVKMGNGDLLREYDRVCAPLNLDDRKIKTFSVLHVFKAHFLQNNTAGPFMHKSLSSKRITMTPRTLQLATLFVMMRILDKDRSLLSDYKVMEPLKIPIYIIVADVLTDDTIHCISELKKSSHVTREVFMNPNCKYWPERKYLSFYKRCWFFGKFCECSCYHRLHDVFLPKWAPNTFQPTNAYRTKLARLTNHI